MKIRNSITAGFLIVALSFAGVLGLSLFANLTFESQTNRQLKALGVLHAWEALAHSTTRILVEPDPVQVIASWQGSISRFVSALDACLISMDSQHEEYDAGLWNNSTHTLLNHWTVVKGEIDLIERNLEHSRSIYDIQNRRKLSLLEVYNEISARKALTAEFYMAVFDIRRFDVFSSPFRNLIHEMIMNIDAEAQSVKRQMRLITYLFSAMMLIAAGLFLGAVRETERRETYERLIAAHTTDVIWTMHPSGKITYCSPAIQAIRGFTAGEVRKIPLVDLLTPESAKIAKGIIEEEFPRKRDGDRFAATTRIVQWQEYCKDGSMVWTETKGTFLRNHKGSVTEIIGITRDITQRRAMDRALRERERLESLGILAGGIAHDFNNLLTAITGNISLLKLIDNGGEEAFSCLEDMEHATLRARELTQQLLTFSKGGVPVKHIADVGAIIAESARFVLRGTAHELRLDIAENLWPAEIDKGQISQVTNNLVINAAQAMSSGGVISIVAENASIQAHDGIALPNGNYVSVKILDQGVGIAHDNIEKIFDPFFTTKEQGSGLGLASSYSIIKAHGGSIRVTSQPGQGSEFVFYLPAFPEQKIVNVISEERSFLRSARVLIMDDDKSIRKALSKMLELLGHTTVAVSNGNEAILEYQSAFSSGKPYDLVILDLTVPGGMGGKETLRQLLNKYTTVKAIASSGYSIDPIISDFASYGFSGRLIKPYLLEDLRRAVNAILNVT